MDVAGLRVFVAVAEELHFGRAARRLHLAQPPVTRMVRRLETELGTPLFVRTTRSVSLTPAGSAMLGPARDAIESVDRARAAVAAVADDGTGVVRVVYAGASSQILIGQLAAAVRDSGRVELGLAGSAYGDVAIKRVTSGDADLALGRWDAMPRSLLTLDVTTERLVMAVPADDALVAQGFVRFSDLRDAGFVTLPDESVLVRRLRDLSQNAGFEPTITQVAPDTATLIALVAAGLGYSLTVSSAAQVLSTEPVVFLPITPDPPLVRVRLAWRRDDRAVALQHVLAIAQRLWSSGKAIVPSVE